MRECDNRYLHTCFLFNFSSCLRRYTLLEFGLRLVCYFAQQINIDTLRFVSQGFFMYLCIDIVNFFPWLPLSLSSYLVSLAPCFSSWHVMSFVCTLGRILCFIQCMLEDAHAVHSVSITSRLVYDTLPVSHPQYSYSIFGM